MKRVSLFFLFMSVTLNILLVLAGVVFSQDQLENGLKVETVIEGETLCELEVFVETEEVYLGEQVKLNLTLSSMSSMSKALTSSFPSSKILLSVSSPSGDVYQRSIERLSEIRLGSNWKRSLTIPPTSPTDYPDYGKHRVEAQLVSSQGELCCGGEASFNLRSGFGRSTDPNPLNTLIVATNRTEYGEPFVTKLSVWLQAIFPTEVRIIDQDQFSTGNMSKPIEETDVIIYYGTDYERAPPEEFIKQAFGSMGAGSSKLVWIGYHAEKLERYLTDYGLSYDGLKVEASPDERVLYLDNDAFYPLLNRDRIFLISVDPELSTVRATFGDRPLITSASRIDTSALRDEFYFFGFHPTAYVAQEGAHLIFLDLMHEVYGIKKNKRALIRLEDVNPSTNPAQLRQVTEFLCKKDKPFTISLIPFYLGTEGRLIALRESEELVKTIKESLNCEAEIVLHGATHQYRGITGVDSEFWDEERGVPLETVGYIQARLSMAIGELKELDLWEETIGWETPHYKAGDSVYAIFETQFDILYETPHWDFDLHLVPYPIIRERALYLPTNLGYCRAEAPVEHIKLMLEEAGKINRLLYGGVASFFYHSWLGVDNLKALIDGLTAQGWSFVSASSLSKEFCPQCRREID